MFAILKLCSPHLKKTRSYDCFTCNREDRKKAKQERNSFMEMQFKKPLPKSDQILGCSLQQSVIDLRLLRLYFSEEIFAPLFILSILKYLKNIIGHCHSAKNILIVCNDFLLTGDLAKDGKQPRQRKSQKTSFGEPETKKPFLSVDKSQGLNAVKPQVQKAHKHRIEYSSLNMHIQVDMA